MTSKLNPNYDKILQDAIVKKQNSDLDERARQAAKQLAREKLDDILRQRENLRPGEGNYYGNMLWSRLDHLTEATAHIKEVLSDVFDNSAQAIQAAKQAGVLPEFITGIQDEARQRSESSVRQAFDPWGISQRITSSWASKGGQERFDETIHRKGDSVSSVFQSQRFWGEGYQDTMFALKKSMLLDAEALHYVDEFQKGDLSASELSRKTKQLLVDHIDQAFSAVKQDLTQSADIIEKYDAQWRKSSQDSDFKDYFVKQISKDLSSEANEQSRRLLSFLMRVGSMDQGVRSPVSLEKEDFLLRKLEKREIKSAEAQLFNERRQAQAQLEKEQRTVLSMDNFPSTPDPSEDPPANKPWYKKIKLFGS